MFLEAEVYGLLKWAFIGVMLCSFLVVSGFYYLSRSRSLLWLYGHMGFNCAAFYFFYECVTHLPNRESVYNLMHSENQSMNIGLAGVCWAVGMALLLVGVYRLLPQKREASA